jgi:hypothetical protein
MSGLDIVNASKISLSYSARGLPSMYNPIPRKVLCMSFSTYLTLLSFPKVVSTVPFSKLCSMALAFCRLIAKYSWVIPKGFPVDFIQTIPRIFGGSPLRQISSVLRLLLVLSQKGMIFVSQIY